MAVVYLRSTDGADGDSGATWALAKATLASALTAAGAGGTVYVSQVHAETQASAMTLTSPGTAASPVRVICVNDGAEPPTALATTATVTTTGGSAMTFSTGVAYVYGISFKVSGNNNHNFSGSGSDWRLDSCRLIYDGTVSQKTVVMLGDPVYVEWINTGVDAINTQAYGVTTQRAGRFVWRDTSSGITGAVAGSFFAGFDARAGGIIEVRGVDLSGWSSSLIAAGTNCAVKYKFENCKLHASATFVSGSITSSAGMSIDSINCDSADTNYRFHRQTYQGTITHETTIVRTGGSTDGTTPFSRKMVTTANSKVYSPLEGLWTTFWNESLSSMTVSAEVVTDGVTLTDAEAWIEVEYLGNGSFPISTTITDRVSDIIFGTPANQTTSSATWTTTGLSSPTKQTLSVTFTPAEKGPIRAKVCLAKASTTMYVDQLRLSGSGRQYMIGAEGVVNEGAAGSSVAFNPLGGVLV